MIYNISDIRSELEKQGIEDDYSDDEITSALKELEQILAGTDSEEIVEKDEPDLSTTEYRYDLVGDKAGNHWAEVWAYPSGRQIWRTPFYSEKEEAQARAQRWIARREHLLKREETVDKVMTRGETRELYRVAAEFAKEIGERFSANSDRVADKKVSELTRWAEKLEEQGKIGTAGRLLLSVLRQHGRIETKSITKDFSFRDIDGASEVFEQIQEDGHGLPMGLTIEDFHDMGAEPERLNPTNLIATQTDLHGDRIERVMNSKEPILVVRRGEDDLIYDGHHRAAGSLLRGRDSLPALVVTLKAMGGSAGSTGGFLIPQEMKQRRNGHKVH